MKHICSFTMIVLLMLSLLASCTQPEQPLTDDELLDLGEKYLLELNYEQALVQFLAVIEIEPMNPRGYTGAAEAYVGLGQMEYAIAVLREGLEQLPGNASITVVLERLGVELESEIVSEPMPVQESMQEPESVPESDLIDMFPTMSKSEHKALHTFFSNFSEVGMDSFDITNYDNNTVIDFALWHDYRNNRGRFTFVNDYLRISAEYIEQNLIRYLGITNIGHEAYANRWNYYRDGYYYLSPADGDPSRWSQVTAFMDNGDGTFTASYDVYYGNFVPDNLYEDIGDWQLQSQYSTMRVFKKGEPDTFNWRADAHDPIYYSYSCTAIVRPYDNKGKATYQLISLKPAQ